MGTVLGAADFSKISFLTCMIVYSSVKHSVRFLACFLARRTPAKPEESSEESDEKESGLLTQQEMVILALMSSQVRH